MSNEVNEPEVPYNQPLTYEKVWEMFQDVAERFKETDRKWQETDRKWQETDQKWQETNKKWLETENLFKGADSRINKLDKDLTSKWGKLMESLVEGDLIKLLRKRGINVKFSGKNIGGSRNGENFEFDILAYNSDSIVLVEVKTTLRPEHVEHFHRKLWKAKTYMPVYKNLKIYGAMAYLTAEGEAQKMAQNQGMFVIRATGSSSSIINQKDFIPKAF